MSFLEHVKIQKIKNVYSALFITSDEQGKNFSIIQSSPKTQLTSLPMISTSHLHLDMLKVLDEASEEDGLHDVILKVKVHSCIIKLINDKDKVCSDLYIKFFFRLAVDGLQHICLL